MEARKFRVLFHNTSHGVFATGSLLDEGKEKGFTYIYAGGSKEFAEEPPVHYEYYRNLGRVNLLTLSDFSIGQIKRILQVIETVPVNMVVYPYLSPIQRRIVLQEAMAGGEQDGNLISFLKDPYRFLKKKGIIFVYPLLGNGPIFKGQEERDCHRFEMVDDKSIEWISEMEGYVQPVMKAGYIIENSWLMFFGCYGMDIKAIRDFHQDIAKAGGVLGEDIYNSKIVGINQMNLKMLSAYLSRFGKNSFGTVVMYSAPNNGGPSVDDSMLMVKAMGNSKMCSPVLTPKSEMCSAYCMYKDDHDECKRHNQMNMDSHIQGILFMGSLNLRVYRSEFTKRFSAIADKVRFYTVPENGREDNWDRILLGWGCKGHRKYFISSSLADASVIKDIVSIDPNHRFLTLNDTYGVCIFGMLVELTKERYEQKSKEHKI